MINIKIRPINLPLHIEPNFINDKRHFYFDYMLQFNELTLNWFEIRWNVRDRMLEYFEHASEGWVSYATILGSKYSKELDEAYISFLEETLLK